MNKAIIFDCDGTLSQLEGINVLAAWQGAANAVSVLTEEAMGKTGMSPDLFSRRLDLVKPTRQQLIDLGEAYYDKRAVDLDQVFTVLRERDYTIYVVSAGMNPSVKLFADKLGVAPGNVFAVDLQFTEQGNYLDFDRHSPLTQLGGKQVIVGKIKAQHDYLAYIGDGMNDVRAAHLADCFVGYGGVFYREHIKSQCVHYIETPSMLPLLSYIQD